jgi:integrase
MAHFLANGGALPAISSQVAAYLARYAGQLAIATLARRLVAIGRAHTSKNIANPCQAELVRLTLRGIRRTYGRPQRQAKALTKEQIKSIVESLGNSLRDSRDRALLLVGFYGAFRRSELIAVDCKSIVRSNHGLVVTIRKSKTDQERKGRQVVIPAKVGSMCPVRGRSNAGLRLLELLKAPCFVQSTVLEQSQQEPCPAMRSASSLNVD